MPAHPTNVLVLRHGQSEWNALGRWQGQADPPLTEAGLQQADAALATLRDDCPGFDAVWSSDLRRAQQTAQVLATGLGIGPVRADPRLRETDAGEWQGLTRDQIDVEFPGYLEAGQRPPGWEDDDEVEARVLAALDQIAEQHPDGMVLAVAHAGVIFAIERVLGAEWERLANLGGRWVEHVEGRWRIGERVHLLVDETIPDQI